MRANNYLIFGKKLLILIVVLILFDFIAGKTLSYLYFKQSSGTKFRTTYALDSTIADVLILGSSRASHHYDAKLLSDSLSLSVYNAGRDGTNIIYSNAILRSILNRYHPKIVVLDINSSEFYNIPTRDENLVSLLPYYSTHPELNSFIKSRSELEFIKLLSKVYPFNSTIVSSLSGLRKKSEIDINGYLPIEGMLDSDDLDTLDFNRFIYSNNLTKNFLDVIKACKESNVRLMIVQSPRFDWYLNDKCELELSSISKQNQVVYASYINDSAFIYNKALFKDQSHLNSIGAIQFTNSLLGQIRPLINQ
jgi:hypothetical protein